MCVCGEWGFMLGVEALLSHGATVSVDVEALKEQLCVPRFNGIDLGVKNRQQLHSGMWFQRIGSKVLLQTKSKVEQVVGPNQNQMEEGKGLEAIK